MSGGDGFTATHWGVYRPRVADGRLTALDPAPWDAAPSAIGRSVVDGIDAPARIRRPAVREGFLRHGPASRDGRGREPFVEVSWEEALDLAARELDRVRREHGNAAIFGGSYGWASAGRFHHAQSQLHRFLNCIGGYTAHSDTYSLGAGRVLMPRILASMDDLMLSHTAWTSLEKHCELFVAFGGLPARNAQVGSGGASDHLVKPALGRLAAGGVRFVNVSPVHHDLDDVPGAEWIAIRPGTDTAFMLGLAHTLVADALADGDFLARCTVGYEDFRRYLTGEADGVAKDAGWAAAIAGVADETIVTLARRMAGSRTMMNLAWSLQRAVHGEQPFWMGVTLAAMLGQIGTPGGGLGVGYSVMNTMGSGRRRVTGPRLPQGRNPVDTAIPVARIADMLLTPGASYRYNGQTRRYPDIRLVHWAGGNAFHHHQDINRLVRAWRRPETVIVQDPFWTAQAKFADIVLPATTTLERDDIGGATGDRFLVWMARALDPVGEARDDHAILAGLARRLGVEAAFTGGLTTEEWLERLYEECRFNAPVALPDFRSFLAAGLAEIPLVEPEKVLLQAFRADPDGSPLPTPSADRDRLRHHRRFRPARLPRPSGVARPGGASGVGGRRRPAASAVLPAGDPPAQPVRPWRGQPREQDRRAGADPHPSRRRGGARHRRRRRGAGVQPARRLPGRCGSDRRHPARRAAVATGAWYDPVDPDTDGSLDAHGNPNMVTPDTGTSALAQGCSAQSALVEVERFTGPLPPIRAFQPPRFVGRP